MNITTLRGLRDEFEKIALSPSTIASAAAKRGVHPSFLKGMVKEVGETRRLRNYKPGFGLKEMAENHSRTAYHGTGPETAWARGQGKKYLASKAKIKTSSGLGGHMAEVAGLGMLAAPTIQKMRGKPMQEKNKDRMELGGLGVLAAPSIHGIVSHFRK